MNFGSTVNNRRYSSLRYPDQTSVETFGQRSRMDLAWMKEGYPVSTRMGLPWLAERSCGSHRMTKLLFNVTVERSLGPVQVLISPENTVRDLIKAAVQMYGKEGRRPLLKDADHRRFELHYSPFSLERLKPEEKLMNLGSRNFFICSKPPKSPSRSKSSRSKKVNRDADFQFAMADLMDLLL